MRARARVGVVRPPRGRIVVRVDASMRRCVDASFIDEVRQRRPIAQGIADRRRHRRLHRHLAPGFRSSSASIPSTPAPSGVGAFVVAEVPIGRPFTSASTLNTCAGDRASARSFVVSLSSQRTFGQRVREHRHAAGMRREGHLETWQNRTPSLTGEADKIKGGTDCLKADHCRRQPGTVNEGQPITEYS